MKKWIIPAVLGLLVLAVAGYWGYGQMIANRSMEIHLNNKYQRAFYDLADRVQDLEVLLSKSLVAADPGLDHNLLMDIRQQAAFAQSDLSQLPLSGELAGRTARFLTQTGDYAYSLAGRLNNGSQIDSENWETMNQLYRQAVELNQELQGVQYQVAQNNSYFTGLVRQLQQNLRETPDDVPRSDFQKMDEQMQRYPTLVYDGPFSEHLEQVEPRALKGLPEITPEEARKNALAFMDRKQEANYQAEVTGNTNGRIRAYRVEVFDGAGNSGDRTVFDISKNGGKVVWMLNSRQAGARTVDVEQARQKALEYLKDHGFGEMTSTYYQLHGNSVTFNLAAVQDGVIIYPDLVKVTVALDNGAVTGVESAGYLMSHRERDLPAVKISREQARDTINPRLETSGGKLVLIPKGATEEKLVYEFQGKLGEDTYLIYINAVDGREENVMKLIETPGGTLTM